ncbi:hypothetical protein KUM39_20895 [Streptomyces sp. J2-1]|uniref:hypothetical protein n=1 Tax=Streptomyces corallincola TaxID=2851888 RepID=UPI001C38AB81|nr:hypothetical protein [Streptomyces corallincola]MBV2356802.1 hypothetical protein [Streptomyces corallincola]
MTPPDEHGGQTRTRLPGTDPYGGAPRRPARSSSRSLITVVGVVVLLIAAIAFANRTDRTRGTTPPSAKNNLPRSAPTAPTGTKPVTTTTGTIPSGFPHTQQGAESAAANYAVALGSAEMFNKARRDFILQSVMSPDRVTGAEAAMDKAYTPAFNQSLGIDAAGNAPSGSTFVSRTTPIGTKTTGYTDDSVTAEVWCSGLLGIAGEKSTSPVTNNWFTITMRLAWTAGDWKIVTNSQKAGPSPLPGDDRASSSGDMSKAVEEYGGFTYAR